MNDGERLVAEIPSSLKYLVDEDDRTNKQIVITALERELGVNTNDSVAVIDRKIRRKEQRLEDELEQAREHRERVAQLKDDLDEVRELREEKVENGGAYEDALDELLEQMETGEFPQVWPTHPRIDDIRGEHGRSNEEIHYDLRKRAADQERALRNTNFMQQMYAEQQRRAGNEQPISESFDGGES
jgi:predicted phage tail protein